MDRPIIYVCEKCGRLLWNVVDAKPCRHGKKEPACIGPWVDVPKAKAKPLRGGLK